MLDSGVMVWFREGIVIRGICIGFVITVGGGGTGEVCGDGTLGGVVPVG